MLLQYAMEQGWELYNIYSDDDYTGADRQRPAFNRLLEDAEKRRFNIILCKTQSRFTRELELVEKYIHGLFPVWGIRFVSIVDNADTANKGNKKSRQINGLVNEWYLEDLSDNIRSVLISRREQGLHIGAFALYGYQKDPDRKGHLIIDEAVAPIVREVFTLYAQGYGKTAIARLLNDRGIPNPTEYKRKIGLRYKPPASKNSTIWKYSAISDMLTNEIYVGNMVQGKYGSVSYKTKQNRPRPKNEWYIVENTHEPIIDRELWDNVQAMLRERAKPFQTGTIGLFAGKVRCACCGYGLRSSKNRGKHYLQCASRHFSKDACEGAFIAEDRLERMVVAEINRLSAEYLDADELERSIVVGNHWAEQKKRIQSDWENYRRKVAEYAKGERELYLDKVRGIITEDNYVEFSKEFREEKRRLEELIAEKETEIAQADEQIAKGNSRQSLIKEYVEMRHLNREIVEGLIDHISIGKRIDGTRDVPIEIHWRF